MPAMVRRESSYISTVKTDGEPVAGRSFLGHLCGVVLRGVARWLSLVSRGLENSQSPSPKKFTQAMDFAIGVALWANWWAEVGHIGEGRI